MADVLWILLFLVLAFLLWKLVIAPRLATQSSSSQYGSSLIKGVETQIGSLEQDVANIGNTTAKEIGGLVVTMQNNASQAAYNASNAHSTTKISGSGLTNANFNNLATGVKGGVSEAASGIGNVSSLVGSSIPNALGGLAQGVSTGVQSAAHLPFFQGIAQDGQDLTNWIGNNYKDVGNTIRNAATSVWKWL